MSDGDERPIHESRFQEPLERAFFELVCGKHLGSGQWRDVYEFGFGIEAGARKKYVIKVETRADKLFMNVKEWDIWNTVRLDPVTRAWIAPCKDISPCGRFLVQERTRPIEGVHNLPTSKPVWFGDVHVQNLGMIGDRIVMHDYAHCRVPRRATASKFKKIDWSGVFSPGKWTPSRPVEFLRPDSREKRSKA